MLKSHYDGYRSLSDMMMFKYDMVHTTRKNDVFADEAALISETLANNFKQSSEILNSLIERILNGINKEFEDVKPYIPDFKYKDEIIAIKRKLPETLWVRYDGFRKADGIFYSELNYDKPCAQRECSFNSTFEGAFGDNFDKDLKSVFKRICSEEIPDKKELNIAFLTAPSRYEETHLAMYVKDILEDDKHSFILAGPDNFNVIEDKVYAFNKQIDVMIRLYPTEFLYEVSDFEHILRLHNNNKFLILNDPRVIIAQCKSLYAYLWSLSDDKDPRLSELELDVITSVLPRTEILSEANFYKALRDKDKYVVKPVFGRYSIDVFIGTLHNEDEWKKNMKYVEEQMQHKTFILQEFCEIEMETAPYYDERFSYDVEAFGNYGIFLSGHDFIGSCIRWNDDYLTEEESTWISSVSINKAPQLRIINPNIDLEKLKKEAILEHGFTGIYAKNYEYLSEEIIIIEEEKLEELKNATEKLAAIFKKTTKLIYNNLDLYGDILGIQNLEDTIKREFTDELIFIGRMDWILDKYGNFKVLELNAETPAGVCESLVVDKLYYDRIIINKNLKINRINDKLASLLKEQFYKILEAARSKKTVSTVAIVSATYYEDWYTINSIYDAVKGQYIKENKDMSVQLLIGSIYDIEVKDEQCYLYGNKIDCFYRFYPLDWFFEPQYEVEAIGKLINKSILSVNPTWSIIPQSKGFFSAIYELLKYNFYDKKEMMLIKKYIPYTTFDPTTLNGDYVVKPLLGREGDKVKLSYELDQIPDYDCIFQETIRGATHKFTIKSNLSTWKENLYPIIGTYIVGETFAGAYTRVGSKITNNICMYSPLYSMEGEVVK
ncbi:glutathionylspermidine synthase family protein [Clostridium sp. YIM B02505]|uniref:Glutathionylspermidine synthase family protein n=1 Tax=Clostridium yunnanense TaxID=2800325 RepID=A0ABS1EUR9_9CLOT|nr:glutathionylspermidine synthase family protein [Clostridium yunnanense]MBK1813074.1 glutathionylspermidine synthase family protein [Clostridium yunnanense]